MTTRRSLAAICSLLFAMITGACSPSGAILPTALAEAAIPPAEQTSESGSDLPATYTPRPGEQAVDVFDIQPLSGTPVPSQTALIPTNTPRPSDTPTATNTPTPTGTSPPTSIPTPGSTARPHIPFNSDPGFSKLSVHVVRNNSPDIMDFVREARPSVMKGVDDFGFLAEVKEASPSTITIGRVDDIFIQNYVDTPEEAAREYVDKHLNTYLQHPFVDYWEGWNEPDPGMRWMSWYARFEQERVRLMAANGLRSAIGGFPPGVPELDEFALFLPAVETAIQYGGIMTLHEGDVSTGDMRYLFGEPLPGYPAYPDRGSMAFRYRWFYRELLEPANLVIPLVISELVFAGWKRTASDEDLIYNQLAWYDSEARKDSYVIGFLVFTAGANSQWRDYNLNSILPELTEYVAALR